MNSTSWHIWSRTAFYKWDGLFSINAVVMHLGTGTVSVFPEGKFIVVPDLVLSVCFSWVWVIVSANSDPGVLIFWVTFQLKDTSLHHWLQIWRDITGEREGSRFAVDWGVRRWNLETWEKYSNEKFPPGCLWAIRCLWRKSQYAICTSSENEMLWKLGLLWHLLSRDLSVLYRHHSWGNESPQTSTQSQNMPVANQEKRQNPCLYCFQQGDAALSIATLREILICASCFLLFHRDSLLYIHCDRGKEIHVAAVGPLPQSIYPSVSSCKTQGSVYLFTSWEEESVLTPPVRSDVISGKGRALEALSWPRHMR